MPSSHLLASSVCHFSQDVLARWQLLWFHLSNSDRGCLERKKGGRREEREERRGKQSHQTKDRRETYHDKT